MNKRNFKEEKGMTTLAIILLIILAVIIISVLVVGGCVIYRLSSSSKDYVTNTVTENNINNSTLIQNNNNSLGKTIIIDGFKFNIPHNIESKIEEKMLMLENEDLTVRMALKISDKTYEEYIQNPESLTLSFTNAGYEITKNLTEKVINGTKCSYFTCTMDDQNVLFAYAKGNNAKGIVTQAIIGKGYETESLDLFTKIIASAKETIEPDSEIEEANINSSTDKKSTVIEYDITYTKNVSSLQQAIYEIQQEGKKQRQKYNNTNIKKIETEMEEKYGILAVNLGEMDIETANSINEAFDYVYKQFPELKGSITNLTLANITNLENDALALVDDFVFISSQKSVEYPIVVKHEMLLSAREFLNTTRMKNTINFYVQNGHWQEGSNVKSVITHELCHTIIDLIKANKYELDSIFYIDESNSEAYKKYLLEDNENTQDTAKEIVTQAFEKCDKDISFDEFLNSISGYAISKYNKSGNYRYEEICAEAYADYYLNGEKSSYSSRLVLAEMITCYNKYCK